MLRADDLHKTYVMGKATINVLSGASISAEKGEFLVILGSSGSGKSTLLHLLGALDIPDRGDVSFQGQSVFHRSRQSREDYRNREVGFVFQFYHLLPELTVLENVIIPRLIGTPALKWLSHRREAKKEAQMMLERVGLSHRVKHRPNELSGGERQRVAMARALINKPTLLLADEPTGNLDEKIGAEILSLLNEFNDAGQTVIMVTHDVRVAACAHRQVRLTGGKIESVVPTRPSPALA